MKKIKNFGFLMFPDLEELDLVGPWEIIRIWAELTGEPKKCLLVSADGDAVRCVKGMRIAADADFESCPPLDALLIPGGDGRKRAMIDENLLRFVRSQAARGEAVLSVCTGSFVLHAAGLLEGEERVASNWQVKAEFEEKTRIKVADERFVRSGKDGKIWTAAGVSAGIDLALAFVAERAGEETAGRVQWEAEYYPSAKIYAASADLDLPNYVRKIL